MQKKNIWPPEINKYVSVYNDTINSIFAGKVIKYIWDNTAVIISLLNNKDYEEPIIVEKNLIPDSDGTGYMIILEENIWDYIDDKTLKNLLKFSDTYVNKNKNHYNERQKKDRNIGRIISDLNNFIPIDPKIKEELQEKLDIYKKLTSKKENPVLDKSIGNKRRKSYN